jgi:hypothetical protein
MRYETQSQGRGRLFPIDPPIRIVGCIHEERDFIRAAETVGPLFCLTTPVGEDGPGEHNATNLGRIAAGSVDILGDLTETLRRFTRIKKILRSEVKDMQLREKTQLPKLSTVSRVESPFWV